MNKFQEIVYCKYKLDLENYQSVITRSGKRRGSYSSELISRFRFRFNLSGRACRAYFL